MRVAEGLAEYRGSFDIAVFVMMGIEQRIWVVVVDMSRKPRTVSILGINGDGNIDYIVGHSTSANARQ